MALTFFWRCGDPSGSTTLGGDDYSAGDTTATLTSATLSTTRARVGTYSLYSAGVGHNAAFSPTSIAVPSEGSAALSIYIDNSLVEWSSLLRLVGSGDDQISLRLNSSPNNDELILKIQRDGETDGDVVTSAANLALDTWYGIVIRWRSSDNSRAIEVYDASNSLITSASSTASVLFPTSFTEIRIGDDGGGGAWQAYIDNVFIADDYDEPLEDYLDITSYTEYSGGGPSIAVLSAYYRMMRDA